MQIFLRTYLIQDIRYIGKFGDFLSDDDSGNVCARVWILSCRVASGWGH